MLPICRTILLICRSSSALYIDHQRVICSLLRYDTNDIYKDNLSLWKFKNSVFFSFFWCLPPFFMPLYMMTGTPLLPHQFYFILAPLFFPCFCRQIPHCTILSYIFKYKYIFIYSQIGIFVYLFKHVSTLTFVYIFVCLYIYPSVLGLVQAYSEPIPWIFIFWYFYLFMLIYLYVFDYSY